jgi:hypothetical protein
LFNTAVERELCANDAHFKEMCFWQAVSDINNGVINAGKTLYHLKGLQDVSQIDEVS